MKNILKFSLYLFFTVFVNFSYSQIDTLQSKTTNIFKLNFFLPGISYEQSISRYSTLYFTPYLDGIISDGSNSPNSTTHLFFTPSFNAEFRNYSISMKHREEKGLRTAYNSANYFAALYVGRYSKTSYETDQIWINQLAGVWGIQRIAPKGFSLDLHFGLIYTFNAHNFQYYNPIELLVQLSLGYRIGKIQ